MKTFIIVALVILGIVIVAVGILAYIIVMRIKAASFFGRYSRAISRYA